jgi:hypothetical protein
MKIVAFVLLLALSGKQSLHKNSVVIREQCLTTLSALRLSCLAEQSVHLLSVLYYVHSVPGLQMQHIA